MQDIFVTPAHERIFDTVQQPSFAERAAEAAGAFIGRAMNAVESVAERLRRGFNARRVSTAMLGAVGLAGAVFAAKNGFEANVAETGMSSSVMLGSLLGIVVVHTDAPSESRHEDAGLDLLAFQEA